MVIPEGMLAHIRHAERWLRRARSDCGRGEGRQAVLRLLLAEAEIRRARESGADAPPSARPGRSSWTVVGAVAAAGVIAAAYVLAGLFATSPAAPGVIRGLPAAQRPNSIVRFESGRVLPLVGLPAGVRSDGRTRPGFVWSSEDPLLSGDASPELVTFR
jgi:hypothetical protein